MNIVFQSYAFYPSVGGIESSARLFIREFTKLGCEIRVHTMTELGDNEEIQTVSVSRNPSVRERLNDFSWADVIYQHNPSLQLGWPAILCNAPKVVSIRTWIRRNEDEHVSMKDHLKRFWVSRQTVISNSRATAAHLNCPSTVIENAYDDATFCKTTETDGRSGLIFVGRLVREKGCHTLLDALAQLKAVGQQHHLTIIGEGSEKAALRQQAETLSLTKQVEFSGPQPAAAVAEMLNRHKYHIIPSQWAEPFGIVALEGIACGCIPIGTNQGGLVDAIGECGPLIAAEDSAALAGAINQLETQPELYRQYLSKHQHHLNNHRPEMVAKQYLEIFDTARRT